MSETDISRDIREKLEAHGYRVERINSGRVKVKGGWMHLATPGTPDTLVLWPTYCWLETKTPIGKLNEAQKLWHSWANKVGVFVAVVRSAAEALDAVKRWEKN